MRGELLVLMFKTLCFKELFFIEKLRDEIKFENSDQLKRQILSDIDKSKKCFENYLSQIK